MFKNILLSLFLLFTVPAYADTVPLSSVVTRVLPGVVEVDVIEKVSIDPSKEVTTIDKLFMPIFKKYHIMDEIPTRLQFGTGSGYIISQNNNELTIVTNYHVAGTPGDMINVIFSTGENFPATLVKGDKGLDIAVIKVEQLPKTFAVLKFGDSDKVLDGDSVFAIGNPIGLVDTVTQGIISSTHRVSPDSSIPYGVYLQTDAAINHGNSGGPLFNTEGEIIGMNSEIVSDTGSNIGLALAIPAKAILWATSFLDNAKDVPYPTLGVNVLNVTNSVLIANNLQDMNIRGLFVIKINDKSDAMNKLKLHDIITEVNGVKITNLPDLKVNLFFYNIGTPAVLTIIRNGDTIHVPVIIKNAIDL